MFHPFRHWLRALVTFSNPCNCSRESGTERVPSSGRIWWPHAQLSNPPPKKTPQTKDQTSKTEEKLTLAPCYISYIANISTVAFTNWLVTNGWNVIFGWIIPLICCSDMNAWAWSHRLAASVTALFSEVKSGHIIRKTTPVYETSPVDLLIRNIIPFVSTRILHLIKITGSLTTTLDHALGSLCILDYKFGLRVEPEWNRTKKNK